MFDTHIKGEKGQLAVQSRALEKGFITSKPTLECRYDLIIDTGKSCDRVQIKYIEPDKKGKYNIYLRKMVKTGKYTQYGPDDIDMIIAYLPDKNDFVAISSKDFNGKKGISLKRKDNGKAYTSSNFVEDYIW